MALIQCLLGSASPVLSSQTYSFERDAYGRFVCEVFDLLHIQCFLSREDIYREVKAVPDKPIKAHTETLLGSSILPSMVLIAEGIEVQLGTVVERAHRESGLSLEDWNDLVDADREALLAATVEAMKAEAAPKVIEPEPAPVAPEPEAAVQEPEPAAEPETAEPEAEADEAGEEGDGEPAQETPAVDAVVSGIVTEAAVKPAKAPRRGRRGR